MRPKQREICVLLVSVGKDLSKMNELLLWMVDFLLNERRILIEYCQRTPSGQVKAIFAGQN